MGRRDLYCSCAKNYHNRQSDRDSEEAAALRARSTAHYTANLGRARTAVFGVRELGVRAKSPKVLNISMAELTAHELVHRLRIEHSMWGKVGTFMNMSASVRPSPSNNDVLVGGDKLARIPTATSALGARKATCTTCPMLRSPGPLKSPCKRWGTHLQASIPRVHRLVCSPGLLSAVPSRL
jgi:hypothetical protein